MIISNLPEKYINYEKSDYAGGNALEGAAFRAVFDRKSQIEAAKGASKTDYARLVRGVCSFEDVFPNYQVIMKVGSCNVSASSWQRNDFPFWEYFKKNTPAEALNDWKPSGANPSQLAPEVQRNLSSIGSGKMCILITEKLQEKMDADPAYAEEIYAKVAKWKADYDGRDNAIAATLGMDVAAHQFSKSYCLQLDEEGNVQNATVTGGGGEITGPTKEQQRQFEEEQAAKRKRRARYRQIVTVGSMKQAELERAHRAGDYDAAVNISAWHIDKLVKNCENNVGAIWKYGIKVRRYKDAESITKEQIF